MKDSTFGREVGHAELRRVAEIPKNMEKLEDVRHGGSLLELGQVLDCKLDLDPRLHDPKQLANDGRVVIGMSIGCLVSTVMKEVHGARVAAAGKVWGRIDVETPALECLQCVLGTVNREASVVFPVVLLPDMLAVVVVKNDTGAVTSLEDCLEFVTVHLAEAVARKVIDSDADDGVDEGISRIDPAIDVPVEGFIGMAGLMSRDEAGGGHNASEFFGMDPTGPREAVMGAYDFTPLAC